MTNRCCTIHAYRTDTTLVHQELLASPHRVISQIAMSHDRGKSDPNLHSHDQTEVSTMAICSSSTLSPDQERHDVLRCAEGQGVLTG